MHAYHFTHFDPDGGLTYVVPEKISVLEKIKGLLFGITVHRAYTSSYPSQNYETIKLKSNKEIECWLIKADSSKGTVILFHGYADEKSSNIKRSDEFLKMGYNTMLVDFMGSGGSEGNHTTIGYKESEEVKTCYDYIKEHGEKNIILFGSSMGAVAILKAIKDYQITPAALILECPFASLYRTICNRFDIVKIPRFPMAQMLTFWGGVQNGFWAFGFNPHEYAKYVESPTLLLFGEKDDRVGRDEIDKIYFYLNCKKKLVTFPEAGHENYLKKYKPEWTNEVRDFLLSINNK
ncbi:MAG: alpha/beta hydrolase [Ignavibacteriae bacterium]|nr:MAG: alpha/beta hydrolase [Ignavibacteriota bacterium]